MTDRLYESRDAGYCHTSGCVRYATAVASADGQYESIGDGHCIEHTTYPQATPWAALPAPGRAVCKNTLSWMDDPAYEALRASDAVRANQLAGHQVVIGRDGASCPACGGEDIVIGEKTERGAAWCAWCGWEGRTR